MRRHLSKFDLRLRDISHYILGFLEDRLAPFTLIILAGLLTHSICFWDSWRGDESIGTTIRNLVLVIAAIAALPLAIWRSKVAERQANEAQHQSRIAQQQAETAQRSLLNERYQKGAEMLGSKVLSVRLGGIYALARLAREHPGDYHAQIMSLLCAFVRNPTEDNVHDTKLREDVQEVMKAVCTRSDAQIKIEEELEYKLDLSDAVLKGADLQQAHLAGAILKSADLNGANLEDVNLNGATLEGAILEAAQLALADLTGANLESACLKAAYLGCAVLVHADLNFADLTKAHLHGANLSRANLRNCKGLTRAQLSHADSGLDTPPDLTHVVDSKTGEPLVWGERPLV